MKKLLSFLVFFILSNTMFAQSLTKDTTKQVDYFVVKTVVSPKFHLKDKIILRNKTNYIISFFAVALCVNDNYEVLGNCMNVEPGKEYEVASYKKNELKRLRKNTIAIKFKGFKTLVDNIDVPNINPNDFRIALGEERHDLIIEIYNNIF